MWLQLLMKCINVHLPKTALQALRNALYKCSTYLLTYPKVTPRNAVVLETHQNVLVYLMG